MQESKYRRPKLGEWLIERGKVTPWQVEEALARQAEWGMRFGSCLVGLGHLSLDDVSEALAAQLGVPEAPPEAFDAADAQIIATVPRGLCAKHLVFPLSVEGKRLQLAMRDPNDLSLVDGLAFSLGYIIQSMVAPQLRLLEYLKKHQIVRWECPFPDQTVADERLAHVYVVRYEELAHHRDTLPELALGLVAELATTQPLSDICRRSPLSVERILKVITKLEGMGVIEPRTLGGTVASLAASADSAPIPEPLASTTLLAALGRPAPASPTAGLITPPLAPSSAPPGILSAKAVLERLAETTDREELLELLVQPMLEHTSLSVLFVVRGKLALGYRASIAMADDYHLNALAIPLTEPSLLQHAYQLRTVVRGRARDDNTQYQIANLLGAPRPREVCVAPICLGERVVNLLCVQSHEGTTLPDGAVEGLRILTGRVAEAYARMMHRARHS